MDHSGNNGWHGTTILCLRKGGQVVMAPITYQVAGKQYVSVISGHTLVTFALRN